VQALKWAVFAALLVVLTMTDLRERILPDAVNFTGLGLGLLLSFFTPPDDNVATWLANRIFAFPPPEPVLSLADAVLGAAVASGLLWLVAEGYFRRAAAKAWVLGDVKMMAMAGAFLGLQRALLTILLGSVLGALSAWR
jgi:leader peptidase (prepilin peptidase)/N-methyltransferase